MSTFLLSHMNMTSHKVSLSLGTPIQLSGHLYTRLYVDVCLRRRSTRIYVQSDCSVYLYAHTVYLVKDNISLHHSLRDSCHQFYFKTLFTLLTSAQLVTHVTFIRSFNHTSLSPRGTLISIFFHFTLQ